MMNTSLLGYQSNSAAARNAFDLCMFEEEKRRAKQGKSEVYNVFTGKRQVNIASTLNDDEEEEDE